MARTSGFGSPLQSDQSAQGARQRTAQLALMAGITCAFGAIAAQLMLLGTSARPAIALAAAEPVATSFSRPDIIDRNGRLLATDLEAPSLFADPSMVLDRDEVVEKLATIFPDLDQGALRLALSDRDKRFVWVRRGISPAIAQKVHNLGLPGLAFRNELRRAYPAGRLAGHVLGAVNVDNRGLGGIEKFIDDRIGVDAVHSATLSTRAPVRLSVDLGVQYALEDELDTAVRRFKTKGAAGLVLDVKTGEVLATASFPRIDPSKPDSAPDLASLDKITGSTFELGSVFKTLTVAMAFDEGVAAPDTVFDVREPLAAGRFTISDFHPSGRPLSVTEIFTHSSNVGSGMLALKAGPEKMKAFFKKVGLLTPMRTEGGPISPPQLPRAWERVELITMSYGHGLAVAPMQFAAAAAALFNGGRLVTPTLIKATGDRHRNGRKLVTAETSRRMARLFRQNVMDSDGTGKRADVAGYRVGGKTGTADRAGVGGYQDRSVLSSFLATFPTDDPRYLTFVLLFEPQATAETNGQRTASMNAAPVTGRLIARIAPQLGVAPLTIAATQ